MSKQSSFEVSNESGSELLADRVTINVGGIKFETRIATLQNIDGTRLSWLTENINPDGSKSQDFFFDRHSGAFVHILNFYRTGKLHSPTDMCGPAFEEELEFWGIDEKQMEPCCWEGYTKHREAEENLRTFEGPGFEDLKPPKQMKTSLLTSCHRGKGCFDGCFDSYLEKVWELLDDPHSSKLAKVFSLFSCFMIVISVSAYCLSTMDTLKGNVLLRNINYFCVSFFTVECTLRILSTPNPKEFIRDYKNWIDLISILPSYLVLVFPKAEWVLLQTLKASLNELGLLLVILLIPLVIFSSIVYALEYNINKNNSAFTSVPVTFWWCIITMTTVGYGDYAPKTWPGRLIGSACSVFGVLIVALPISVIGGNFSLYYSHVKARLKLPRKNRPLQQDNMLGLLRHPLGVSMRHRDRKTLKRTKHHAIRLKTDVVVSPTSAIKILHRQECFDGILKADDVDVRMKKSDASMCSSSTENIPEMIPLKDRARGWRRNAIIQLSNSENGSIEGTTNEDFNKRCSIGSYLNSHNSSVREDSQQRRYTTTYIDESTKRDMFKNDHTVTIDEEELSNSDDNDDTCNNRRKNTWNLLVSEKPNQDFSKEPLLSNNVTSEYNTLVERDSENDSEIDIEEPTREIYGSKDYPGCNTACTSFISNKVSERSDASSRDGTNPETTRNDHDNPKETSPIVNEETKEYREETIIPDENFSKIDKNSVFILLKILDKLTNLIKTFDNVLSNKGQNDVCEEENEEKSLKLLSKYVLSINREDMEHVKEKSKKNKRSSCNCETILRTISLSSNSDEISTDTSSPNEAVIASSRLNNDNNTINERKIERIEHEITHFNSNHGMLFPNLPHLDLKQTSIIFDDNFDYKESRERMKRANAKRLNVEKQNDWPYITSVNNDDKGTPISR